MAPPLLTLQDMHLTFGGTPLLSGAELSVSRGERLCLVGRNGSGKSTLLKLAAGLIETDRGKRFVHPAASLRYLHQEVAFAGFATARDFVEAGLGPADDPHKAAVLLNELGLAGDEDPSQLSGGEVRRMALAQVLAPDSDILLLDEPTNHLDLPAIEWLEQYLKSMRAALVLISHDRRFLENLSDSTIWLDRGRTCRLDRGFSHFEAWRDNLLEREAREAHKLDRKIAAEEDWIRYGVTGRRKRNVRRVAELADLRAKKREAQRVQGAVNFQASQAEQSGKLVVELCDITRSHGAQPVVAGFSTRIARGDRVGIIGPNGAGKTTLLKLMTGSLEPDSGTVRLGANIEMVTLDQKRDELEPDETVAGALTGGRGDTVDVGGVKRHVIGYMKDFLFGPEQARTPLKVLSGGERARLMLARALARPSNLLVLDEPTNDLDLETLDLLQELLAGYEGTVLLVSHDRDFLDRVVTSVIAFEGTGRWVEYAGGYSDMIVQRRGADTQERRDAKNSRGRPHKSSFAASRNRAVHQDGNSAGGAGGKIKRKLTFKDQHALKTLPDKMEALQKKIAVFQEQLETEDLYQRDREAFDRAADGLRLAQEELARAEDEWLRLEMLREELENN